MHTQALAPQMIRHIILLCCGLSMFGCTSMLTGRLADNLGDAIMSQNDPQIVADGAPSYLIMLDSLVIGSPNDPDILSASANLYSAYASFFVDDPERAAKLTDKALAYARQAICEEVEAICESDQGNIEQFKEALNEVKKDNIKLLFVYGSSWAGWVQSHLDDWNAIAQVPKIEAVMMHVAKLDENHEKGRAYLYLGVINSQLPPALGGKPEIGREFFEKAIRIAEGRDLITKVEFARYYTRLLFDQELHNQLLNEVITADPNQGTLTLSNTIAQKQARELLATSQEYFEE